MGLDQIAYSNEVRQEDGLHDEYPFYWRKHSKLQKFIENELLEKHGSLAHHKPESIDDLNLRPIELNIATIAVLQNSLISNRMPKSEGRFFFGHQWQDERATEYFDQDMQFCSWAIDQISAGHQVFYRADW